MVWMTSRWPESTVPRWNTEARGQVSILNKDSDVVKYFSLKHYKL